jgi:hypothetical protein
MILRILKGLIVSAAVAGTLLPVDAVGSPPARKRPKNTAVNEVKPLRRAIDVVLSDSNELRGTVVDPDGTARVGISVTLVRSGERIASIVTDDHGVFRIGDVKPGLYELHATSGACLCRIWTRKTAPPSAARSILVVDGMTAERGQQPISEVFCNDPILMATIVAAAIAIPIAVHKSREDALPGS